MGRGEARMSSGNDKYVGKYKLQFYSNFENAYDYLREKFHIVVWILKWRRRICSDPA